VQLAKFQLGLGQVEREGVDARLKVDQEPAAGPSDVRAGEVSGGVGAGLYDLRLPFPEGAQQAVRQFGQCGPRRRHLVGRQHVLKRQVALLAELSEMGLVQLFGIGGDSAFQNPHKTS
jgi:hypothetical protein